MVGEPAHYTHAAAKIDCLRRQVERCEAIGDYLSVPALVEAIEDCAKYGQAAFTRILTLTSMIEEVSMGTSSLDDFGDESIDLRE